MAHQTSSEDGKCSLAVTWEEEEMDLVNNWLVSAILCSSRYKSSISVSMFVSTPISISLCQVIAAS